MVARGEIVDLKTAYGLTADLTAAFRFFRLSRDRRPIRRDSAAGPARRPRQSSTPRCTVRSFLSSGRQVFVDVLLVCLGRTTRVMPARRAASTFSFTPPMGKTRPVSVISPVMATSPRQGWSVKSDARP